MAKKSTKSSSSKKLKNVEELSIFFNSKNMEEFSEITRDLPNREAVAVLLKLKDFNSQFGDECDRYIEYAWGKKPNRKKAEASVKKMEQIEQVLIDDLMAIEGGYKVLAAAEKKGAKIDWQKMSPAVIKTEECIAFLADKKYDFNAEHDFNGQKADFTTYHLSATGYWEQETVKSYDELTKQVEEREKLIQDFQKLRAEYDNPETSPERKAQLEQQAIAMNDRYLVLEKEIPLTCQEVNETMNQYFTHAVCLKTVMDKKLISEENCQKIMDSNFRDSVSSMLEREEKMERYNAFFNPQTSVDNHKTDGYALATASSMYEGTLGTLAASEGKESVLTFEQKMLSPTSLGSIISQHAQSSEQNNPNDVLRADPMQLNKTNN